MHFVHFPGPSSLDDQILGECSLPRWGVRLITSPVTAQLLGWQRARLSQVCCVSPLGSYSLTAALLLDVNHPGSQEDLVSNWEPAHSLVEDAVSEAKFVPCLLALAAAHLPLAGQGTGLQLANFTMVFTDPGSTLG